MEQHIVLDEESELLNKTLYWMKSRINETTHCIGWRVGTIEQHIVLDEESDLWKKNIVLDDESDGAMDKRIVLDEESDILNNTL